MLDLILFIVILAMIILAFGTLSVAILEPRSPLDRHILKSVIKRPYFQMYGELHLDEFESGKRITLDGGSQLRKGQRIVRKFKLAE